ncbi:putative DNA polymerase III, delta' subunit [uncultured Eubacteriales bacterium]|uniref:Putative DNA polymerase III, delta' subunit n=1 Tax=uncultured Eubacteriales bacterium TaxID=172733 RepID=A0A212KLE4_9FIRM|nr:putative DNA polymerase III, delta' subunit [uncultured Eubacteriales bacterium]
MNLSQLAGNMPLKRQLSAESAGRGLSHAYILAGPAGTGKHTLARLLAAALVCEGAGDKPCETCPHCRKALRDIHPDVIRIGGDGKDINVAQVRALRSDAYIRPNEASRKVYLLENAQTMNPSAQNAMLKLLEEGPAYAAFLLLTDNSAALLATVRSRCEGLTLSPVTDSEAEGYLRARYPEQAPRAIAELAARCEGVLGRAVAELEGSGGTGPVRDGAVKLLRLLSKGDELALLEFSVSLEKWEREDLEALLGETILLLRHALVCSNQGNPGESDPERLETARMAADKLTPRALLAAAETLEKLRAACGYNAGTGHLAGWLCAALSG